MTIEQVYGQVTEQGVKNALVNIHSLDDNITIGELRAFLTKRAEEAKVDTKLA